MEKFEGMEGALEGADAAGNAAEQFGHARKGARNMFEGKIPDFLKPEQM